MCNTSAPSPRHPPGTCPQECIAQTHRRTPRHGQPSTPGVGTRRGTQGHTWGHVGLGPVHAGARRRHCREMATGAMARRWQPRSRWGRGGAVPTPCPRGNRGATAAVTILQPCPCTLGGPKPPPPCDNPLVLCQAELTAVSPPHRATMSPHHRVTAARRRPSPRRFHGTEHPTAQTASAPASVGNQRQEGFPPPHRTPPRPRGPPRVCVGSGGGDGGGAGGGLIFSTHIEARMRESRAVCISDPPASGR